MTISLQMLFNVQHDPAMVISSESSFIGKVHVYTTSPSAVGVETSLDLLQGCVPDVVAVPVGEVDI